MNDAIEGRITQGIPSPRDSRRTEYTRIEVTIYPSRLAVGRLHHDF